MEYLVVTILGENRIGIVNEFTNVASSCECNIVDCRMSTLGSEFTASILFSGNWSSIAKLESQLEIIGKKHNLQLNKQRTNFPESPEPYLPYIAYIAAIDEIGIISQVTEFFYEQNIHIHDLLAETYTAKNSNVRMLALTLAINVHKDIQVAEFRERFILFCDGYNLDGILEVEKT